MEITYDDFPTIHFRELINVGMSYPQKSYFTYRGEKIIVPEGEPIPDICGFKLPDNIHFGDFEAAVLSLADKINGKNETDATMSIDPYAPISYTPVVSNEDKLIDIIAKLSGKIKV